jgi:FkbM family methyltransferase
VRVLQTPALNGEAFVDELRRECIVGKNAAAPSIVMLGVIKGPLRQLRNLLRRAGLEVNPGTIQHSRGVQLTRLLQHLGIDLVLDVGANTGQYGSELRLYGYRGRIVSFEPLAAAHAALERASRRSRYWAVAPRMAIGDADAEIEIHVAGNSVSSSILDMLPAHELAAPGSTFVAAETVPVRRLDGVAGEYIAGARRILLKIDTQGYEDRVLTGAAGVLDCISAIQTELSLVPLYAGQVLFDEMRRRIEAQGFELHAVFPGYVDERTGQTLQLDGFFRRRG